MEITIKCPALDRLCDILEKGVSLNGVSQPASGPVKVEKAEKPAKAEKEKPVKAEKEKPVKAEKPAKENDEAITKHSVEGITELARKLMTLSSPAVLRKTLDDAGIKGKKIGEADESDYPAIVYGLTQAIAQYEAV